MSWLYRLQQRLSITKNEALTLLSLSLFLLVGTIGRHACRQVRPVSAEYYAEVDSLFAERSAAVLGHAEEAGRHEGRSDAHGVSLNEHEADTSVDGARERARRAASSRMATGSHIATPPESPRAGTPQNTSAISAAPRPLGIDLNHATLQELDQLPRVGPRTAERIVAFRENYGPFRSVDELISVSGIGPKTLEQIRPHVYVAADSTE